MRELEERKAGVEKATQAPQAETKEDSGKGENVFTALNSRCTLIESSRY